MLSVCNFNFLRITILNFACTYQCVLREEIVTYYCVFLWCAAHVKLFFTSRKSSVFRKRQQVTCEICECLFPKRSEDLVEKIGLWGDVLTGDECYTINIVYMIVDMLL